MQKPMGEDIPALFDRDRVAGGRGYAAAVFAQARCPWQDDAAINEAIGKAVAIAVSPPPRSGRPLGQSRPRHTEQHRRTRRAGRGTAAARRWLRQQGGGG